MDLVNGISLYSMRCAEVRKKLKETMGITEETKVTQTQTMNATSDLKAKDVLEFMANQSLTIKAEIQKTIKTTYKIPTADTDTYSRIANSMKNFENAYDTGMATLDGDFANLNIPSELKSKIVLKSINTLA